jgi:hypothetical protein
MATEPARTMLDRHTHTIEGAIVAACILGGIWIAHAIAGASLTDSLLVATLTCVCIGNARNRPQRETPPPASSAAARSPRT